MFAAARAPRSRDDDGRTGAAAACDVCSRCSLGNRVGRAGRTSFLCVLLLVVAAQLPGRANEPLSAWVLPAGALNTCEEISHCSECVYDPTNGLMPPVLHCGWCASTNRCVDLTDAILQQLYTERNASYAQAFCPDLREIDHDGRCPDAMCGAAKTTNNVYFCHADNIVALVFAFLLLCVNGLYFFWMRAIQQRPWRYEPWLSDEMARRLRGGAPVPCGVVVVADGDDDNDNATTTATTAAPTLDPQALHIRMIQRGGVCPLCKSLQPATLGPGQVCHWCAIARLAFLPLFIGLWASLIVIVLDFSFALKPWFSKGYFAVVLLAAYGLYAVLGIKVVVYDRRRCIKRFPVELYDVQPTSAFVAAQEKRLCRTPAASPAPPSSHTRRARTRVASDALPSVLPHAGTAGEEEEEEDGRAGGAGADVGAGPARQARARGVLSQQEYDAWCLWNTAQERMQQTLYVELAFWVLRGRALPPLLARAQACGSGEGVLCHPYGERASGVADGRRGALSFAHSHELLTASLSPPVQGEAGGAASSVRAGRLRGSSAALDAEGRERLPEHPRVTCDRSSSGAGGGGQRHTSATMRRDGRWSATHRGASSSSSSPRGARPHHAEFPKDTADEDDRKLAVQEEREEEAASGRGEPADGAAASQPTSRTLREPTSPGRYDTRRVGGGGDSGVGGGGGLPDHIIARKQRETTQLLNTDFLGNHRLRRALQQTLYREEVIVWYSAPRMRVVAQEDAWLLVDLTAGLLVGVWLLWLSSLTDERYAIVRLSGSTSVAVFGMLCIGFFALLLITTARGLKRLYVLTDERLLTVYEGILSPVVTTTDTASVRHAVMYGYPRSFLLGMFGLSVASVSFSWEVPAAERKLPPIKSHSFPGITKTREFLMYFRHLAPPPAAGATRERGGGPAHLSPTAAPSPGSPVTHANPAPSSPSLPLPSSYPSSASVSASASASPSSASATNAALRDERRTWQLQLFVCTGMLLVLPLTTIYPVAVPMPLSCFLFVTVLLILAATISKGLRTLRMTYAPLNLADEWIARIRDVDAGPGDDAGARDGNSDSDSANAEYYDDPDDTELSDAAMRVLGRCRESSTKAVSAPAVMPVEATGPAVGMSVSVGRGLQGSSQEREHRSAGHLTASPRTSMTAGSAGVDGQDSAEVALEVLRGGTLEVSVSGNVQVTKGPVSS